MVIEPAVSLEVFKDHLNKSRDQHTDNEELQRTLAAATAIAENDPDVGVGPILQRERSVRVAWTRSGAVLPVTSPAEITAFADRYGKAVDFSGIYVSSAGVITGRGLPLGDYDVTFTAGIAATLADVPEDIQLAICIIGKHLWETQRGRSANRVGNITDGEKIPMGFLVPYRAASILRGQPTHSVALA